jgi:putative peptidoglycan lipid II flippase
MVGERDEKTAWRIASIALNLSVLLMVLLALLVIVFARQIVSLYNIGLDSTRLDLIASLTRIMLLQAVFMGASVVVMSVLNARQHFLLPAIAPVLYNVGLIVGLIPGFVLVLAHQRNDVVAVYAATWGVVIGAFCFFAIQLPGLRRVSMRYSFSLNWRHSGIRRIAKQMVPRIVNAAMVNVSTAIDRLFLEILIVVLGSTVLQGLIAQYVFAFGIVLVPLSGVMAVCTAAFPRMTEYVAAGRIDRFRALVIETLRSILFLAIPCSIGLMLLSYPVIQVLYEHGSLNQNEAQSMAIPLFCFALCLPGLAIIEILTRSFYALHSSVTPVIISVGQFLIKIALSILLLNFTLRLIQTGVGSYLHIPLPRVLLNGALGMGGLAIATSIAVLLEAIALLWLLRPQVGGLQLRPLSSFTLRVLIASLIMGAGLLLARLLLDNLLVTTGSDGRASLGIVGILLAFVKLVIIGGVGSFIYLRVSRLIKTLESREIGSVYRLLSKLHLTWV